ncbi:hypothetical protein QE417_000268 [Mucilaginibacter terrae]|uniref:Single-stranded DNA-binding protein n=1 Tax=Mucilaginibacter terrae TaxID=1955052 RepID=A0ABU3GP05_9SPHI|nr:hypothetical protein [Mucilaginibacter terrae]
MMQSIVVLHSMNKTIAVTGTLLDHKQTVDLHDERKQYFVTQSTVRICNFPPASNAEIFTSDLLKV